LAWGVATETGYRLPTPPLKPRFSLRADTSSGDNPTTPRLGNFNSLFPVGNYFGILQDTGPGPINFIDVQPRVETVFPHNVSVMMVLLLFWRESLHDGVYGVSGPPFPGLLLRPSGNSLARFVWVSARGRSLLANRPTCVSSGRLRNLLCRPVSPTNDAR
jgi:hypothetical protein